MEQEYLTPAGFGEAILEEKKSSFIARVWPVATEAEAQSHIAAMRQQHRDATHNVFAYSIRNGQTRYSDDGEPQGTSGMPTLNVFQNEKIENVCCVVTRYYGGILLGAGGLVRAYSKAAKMALDEAGVAIMRQWNVMHIPCPYALYDRMKNLLASNDAIIQTTEFGADVQLEILVPLAKTATLQQSIQDMTAGQLIPAITETVFRGKQIR